MSATRLVAIAMLAAFTIRLAEVRELSNPEKTIVAKAVRAKLHGNTDTARYKIAPFKTGNPVTTVCGTVIRDGYADPTPFTAIVIIECGRVTSVHPVEFVGSEHTSQEIATICA